MSNVASWTPDFSQLWISQFFPPLKLGMGVGIDPKMKISKMGPNGPQTCLMSIPTHFVCCSTLELPKIEIKVEDK